MTIIPNDKAEELLEIYTWAVEQSTNNNNGRAKRAFGELISALNKFQENVFLAKTKDELLGHREKRPAGESFFLPPF